MDLVGYGMTKACADKVGLLSFALCCKSVSALSSHRELSYSSRFLPPVHIRLVYLRHLLTEFPQVFAAAGASRAQVGVVELHDCFAANEVSRSFATTDAELMPPSLSLSPILHSVSARLEKRIRG